MNDDGYFFTFRSTTFFDKVKYFNLKINIGHPIRANRFYYVTVRAKR